MFIKISKIKKLMKAAYEGVGLMVHNNRGKIFIQGASWILVFYDNKMPNEMKGELIKFIGDIPEEGQAFKVTEDGTQMAVDLIDDTIFSDSKAYWKKTNVLFETTNGLYRVVENSETREKKMVDKNYLDVIDLKKLDETENEPDGPYQPERAPSCMAWKNDRMLFVVYTADVSSNTKLQEFLRDIKDANCCA